MVLVQTRVVCGFPQGNSGLSCCTLCSSRRGLRRDRRDYYQAVGTPGCLAGFVLPLLKFLVHRDPEFDRMSHDGGLSPRIVSL